jgi:hypothetical protein
MTVSAHLFLSKVSKASFGHMVVSWIVQNRSVRCRGFRPMLDSIPTDHRSPERCLDFLKHHAVDGEIVNDVAFLERIENDKAECLSKTWPLSVAQTETLHQNTQVGEHGLYSFNPDDFPGADNCVTWCIKTLNVTLGQVLQPVRQGRITRVALQFDKPSEQKPSS